MDFFEDLLIGFQNELQIDGVQLPPYKKSEAVVTLARCAEYRLRRISINKRKVYLSKYLENSNEYNLHKVAVNNLINLSENGKNINPYQSKLIKKFKYSELLLFDWGIQHLHLGEHLPGNPFSERTGPLLFSMFHKSEVYFVAIFGHEWAELEILNIIDREWPHLLAPFTLHGVHGISPILTPSETLECRKAGITVMQQLTSGRIISAPGGGITTAKTSTTAMMDAQRMARKIYELEEFVKKDEINIRQSIQANLGERIRLFEFSYKEQEAILGTLEYKYNIRINF